MHFDFASRRRKKRPQKSPLKVKFPGDEDWRPFEVPRSEFPFLFTLPLFDMPELLSGPTRLDRRDAATQHIWIRGPQFSEGLQSHLEALCQRYGFAEVLPEGVADVPNFCLLLAKIAHSFAIATLGPGEFVPYLSSMIRAADVTEIASVIGGRRDSEARTENLHEVSIEPNSDGLVAVRVRLLAHFEAPTYFVVAGRRL